MKNMQQDIQTGVFQHVYVLYGEEHFLRQWYKQKLLTALNPDGDAMNVASYEGKNIEVGSLIDLAETLPFFAERRILVIEDSGFFKNKCDLLADYLKEIPDYLYLIFSEEQVDKRSRMYKAAASAGRVVSFSTQDEKTLMQWIAGIFSKEGKGITRSDMELFLSKTGSDMGNIHQEAEKLLCYTMGRDKITSQDIEAVCVTQITNKIFDMVRAVTEKNQKRALDLYQDLLALKEPPMRILYLLARQFRHLMQTREMLEEGKGQQEISKTLGVPGFAARNYVNCVKRYRVGELRQAGEDFNDAEEDVKTGRLGDTLSVELLIVKYSR